MTFYTRFAGASALLAAISMAVPAGAADLAHGLPGVAVATPGAWDGDAVDAGQYRRYYRRDRGIDAGDVIAGVVILGGIAAIASAAARSSRDRDYRDRDYRYRDRDYRGGDYRDRPYQYRPYRGDSRAMDSRGINNAIDLCVRAVERDARIQSVDSVDRLTSGWRVEGSIYNGEGFTCRIGTDGRVEDIDYGTRRWNGAVGQDTQWDDEAYRQAWRDQASRQAQPAYPGAPVDGDLIEDGYADPSRDFGG